MRKRVSNGQTGPNSQVTTFTHVTNNSNNAVEIWNFYESLSLYFNPLVFLPFLVDDPDQKHILNVFWLSKKA